MSLSDQALVRPRRSLRSISAQGGFSLIEILVATAVTVLLIGPITAWMILAMKTQGPTATRFSEASQARIANTYLSRDVGSAELVKVDGFDPADPAQGCGTYTAGAPDADLVLMQLVDDVDDGTEVPVRTVYVTNTDDGITSVWRRTCGLNDTKVVTDDVHVLRDIKMTTGSEPAATCAPVTDDPLTDCRQVTFTAELSGGAPVNVRAMRRATLNGAFLSGTGNLVPRARITQISQGGVRPNYNVVLDSSTSSDPDGSIVTRVWSVTPPVSVDPDLIGQVDGPSDTQVTFTFAEIGTYQVTLTVGDGTDTSTDRITIRVENQAPIAKLALDGASEGPIQGGDSPMTFKFKADGSYDPDSTNPVTYAWDFGPGNDPDNTVISGSTATVQYKSSPDSDPLGDREVKVTVRDSMGATAVERVAIRLLPSDGIDPVPSGPIVIDTDGEDGRRLINTPGKLPRAGTVGPGREPVAVTFTTSTPAPYSWDLRRKGGSDPVTTSTQPSLAHAFTAGDAGDWEISVTPDGGEPTTVEFRLNDAPVAGFSAGDIGNAPTSVTLDSSASSDDGTIDGRIWNFGFFNNWTSTTANPTQLFTHPGAYNVTLGVVDDDGASTFKTLQLSVPGALVAPAPGTFAGNVYKWAAVPGAQTYGVHVSASGGAGCPGPSDVTVPINEAPSFTTAYPGCSVTVSHRVQVSGTWGPYSAEVTRP